MGAYEDITSRIAEAPLWLDQHEVPRYEPFHPAMMGYADFAILVEIECQHCARRFKVGEQRGALYKLPQIYSSGGPPNHNCTGDTMSVAGIAVLQAWANEHFEPGEKYLHIWSEWKRHPEYEGWCRGPQKLEAL